MYKEFEQFGREIKEEISKIKSRMPGFFDNIKCSKDKDIGIPVDVKYKEDGSNKRKNDGGKVVYASDKVDESDNKKFESNETEENEKITISDKGDENKELTIKEKQEIADKIAKDYNAKTHPYERAIEKGIENVKKTDNGGVSFSETDKIYTKEDGRKCIVKISATGNRQKDFDVANEAMGLEETPDGYVWHHVDDYNVKDGTITLELVEDEAHNASKPHSGGCAQYDAVNGPSYNPPRKGD